MERTTRLLSTMDNMTVQPEASTETPLCVFISSVMSRELEDLTEYRRVCQAAIDSLRLTRAWTFEGSPASTDELPRFYLDRIAECDIFVLILGKDITKAVEDEYRHAVKEDKPRLLFVIPEARRSARAARWLADRAEKWDGNFLGHEEFQRRVRVAVGDELIRSYRQYHLVDQDFSVIAQELRTEAKSFMVRTITARELTHVLQSLPQIEERYPDFREWLSEKTPAIIQGSARAYVASFADQIAGLAIVVPKAKNVKKISTLYIHPQYQGLGIGPRLLFALVEDASKDETEKLYVTLAEETLPELAPLLEHFGFVAEGISSRRYRNGSSEWVWSKRLLRGYVSRDRLPEFVRSYLLNERASHNTYISEEAFTAGAAYDLIGRRQDKETHLVVVEWGQENNPSIAYRAAKSHAKRLGKELLFVSASPLADEESTNDKLDGLDLEIRFSPLFVQTELDGLVLPIQERFANSLIPKMSQLQLIIPSRVQLSTDKVYYRYPNLFEGLGRGSSLFFYETQRSTGNSLLVGEAKLTEYAVDYPEELLSRFGSLGVYTLKDLQEHLGTSGNVKDKALALRFDFYREFPEPLTLRTVRKVIPTFEPRGPRRIAPAEVKELRKLAGWDVHDICFP